VGRKLVLLLYLEDKEDGDGKWGWEMGDGDVYKTSGTSCF